NELRAELTKRGLDTAGIKRKLDERLALVLLKESRNKKAKTESADDSDLAVQRTTVRAMASSPKVDGLKAELASELAKRGLRLLALKQNWYLERLAAVLLKESRENVAKTESADDADLVVPGTTSGRERGRESQDSDDDAGENRSTESQDNNDDAAGDAVFDLETLRNLFDLKLQAKYHGVPFLGATEKELFGRLSAHIQKDSGSITQDKGEVSGLKEEMVVDKGEAIELKEEKLVKATKKGGAFLDQYLPKGYHVLEHKGERYDVMLYKTDVSNNRNMFHVIQALESDGGRDFMVLSREGHVGDKVQGTSPPEMELFRGLKYHITGRQKIGGQSARSLFVTQNILLVPEELINSQPGVTKLDSRIAKFISLICNVSMMKEQMIEIGYNAKILPLDELSKSTISKGYEALNNISEAITDERDKNTLVQLSGYAFDFPSKTSTLLSLMTTVSKKCVAEFIIDTPQKLKSKIKMVEALGEIELATKLLKDEDDTKGDLLNAWYNRLQCELQAIDADSKDYLMIEKYMRNTHLNADSSYSVDIVQFFRVSTKFESEPFRKIGFVIACRSSFANSSSSSVQFSITKNRMLLWYGSRLANWTGILSQGLHIAPPQSPVSGYMFGKGVYFADMFLKSANLCCPSSSSRDGVLLLCEVALDEMAELRGVHNAVQLPEGKQSIKVVGSTAPDPSESEVLDDGVVVPLGKPKNHGDQKVDLLHNEHIVYSVDQIRMRYLIHVEFNYN
ncbi:hypothetical protein C5167_024465, partial [Papaver somniferum]